MLPLMDERMLVAVLNIRNWDSLHLLGYKRFVR